MTPVPFVSSQAVSAVASTAGSTAAPFAPVRRDTVTSRRSFEELLHGVRSSLQVMFEYSSVAEVSIPGPLI